MIENGSVTYDQARDPLRTLEPQHPAVLQILAAILATILAYQLAGITFDLLVGCKRKGTALASDISILLLAEDSSPYAVLANLGWSRHISRCRYRTSPASSCKRSPRLIRFSVLLKLTFFLAAAPVANLLAIFLTSEVDKDLTFADVSFGGVALGVSSDQNFVATEEDRKLCRRVSTQLRKTDTPVAEFFFCADAIVLLNSSAIIDDSQSPAIPNTPEQDTTVFTVSRDDFDVVAAKNSYSVNIENTRIQARGDIFGEVLTTSGGFHLRNVITQQDGERHLRNGLQFLSEKCRDDPDIQGSGEIGDILVDSSGEDRWSLRGSVECTLDNTTVMFDALQRAVENVTFVETDEFQVVNSTDGEVVRIEGEIFFRRRESLVSFLVLTIVVATSLVIRIIVRVFTNNDLHVGIELLLKDTLNIPPYDSMLSVEDVVDYEKTVYDGHKRCDDDTCGCV